MYTCLVCSCCLRHVTSHLAAVQAKVRVLHEHLEALKEDQLVELCKEWKLKDSGSKTEMIKELVPIAVSRAEEEALETSLQALRETAC